MFQSRASGIHSPKVNNWTANWRQKGKPKIKSRADLEGANYMLGGDSLLRILLTDLVCFGRNEMYEF